MNIENTNELSFSDDVTSYPVSELKEFVLENLEELKAEKIVVIDIAEKSSLADHLIIASGNSSRHVGALAHLLIEKLKEKKIKPKYDGLDGSPWVVLDIGAIIVHIFHPETREFYNLEKLWLFTENEKNKEVKN